MDQALLAVSDLTIGLRGTDRRLVLGVNFTLKPRETVALVGGSGSGKSLTSLAIMRLLDPKLEVTSGQVVLAGEDLLQLPEPEMRQRRGQRISMIFQEPMTSLNPVLSIGRQVGEALQAHALLPGGRSDRAAMRARIVALLDRVGIPSAAKRIGDYPHQFSGGQRQRIVIAMALACNPDMLIADEPTTALDVTVQAQILDLIRELQSEHGMAVLFITHDMGVVAQIADRVVVMRNGKVVETGTTVNVFETPSEPYTRKLLLAVPRLGSMAGSRLPLRFPDVDEASGAVTPPAETAATVDEAAPPVLNVLGLSKYYGGHRGLFRKAASRVRAIEDVSFDIRPGETLSLVGESGSGKSTTARTIIRLQEPSGGEVTFEGHPLTRLKGAALRRERRHIQMIFQDPYASLNPQMSVGAMLAEPLIVHGLATRDEASAKVRELLELVGLDGGAASRLPREFSGGQRQRISIARALSLRPKLIIADEAVSALDAPVKAQIINLMIDLQASLNLAFLFISHDMAVVERISHRVAVMRAGRVVEIGPRAAVFETPHHPYTRSLLSAVPIPDPRRRRGAVPAAPSAPPPAGPTPSDSGLNKLRKVGPDHFAMGE